MPINKKEPPTHIKSESVAFLLVVRNSVSEDFVVTYAVPVYPTAITGVSLNCISPLFLSLFSLLGRYPIRRWPFDGSESLLVTVTENFFKILRKPRFVTSFQLIGAGCASGTT